MKKNLFLAALMSAPSLAFAGNGAEFLRIDTSARAVSMGSAFTAMSDGVNSLSYNPAGLASARGVEFGFSHTNWIMDSRHDFVGAALPLRAKQWVMGLGATRLNNGAIQTRDDSGAVGTTFSSYDQAVSLGAARIMGRAGIGVGVKYIESAIAGEKARAVAMDVGLTHAIKSLPVALGVSIQNLGTPMKYMTQKDPLPLSLAVGAMVSLMPGFNIAIDVKRMVYDRQTTLSAGTEYMVGPGGLALRAGYMLNNNLVDGGNKGLNAGAGLKLWGTDLDYSFTPFGMLGNSQKISMKKRF